ncbi:MAG: hypothetical protein OHK0045_25640 [Raineya sp.]
MKNKLKKIGVLALVLVGLSTYVEASKWKTIADFDDPITGCHTKTETCVSGFGFAFCEVGSTRTTITCPPAGNPSQG